MFKMIHDLSKLNDKERRQYCRDYAEFVGLNPDENRIDTIWMTTGDIRTLVAYCRRGTTDLLREIHGIDVTGLVKEDGPGYVSYQASGINRRGRKEIAVGAYALDNFTGDRLAAAVATAQTRALRRLTLQFIGGGLLDESEVNSGTVKTEPTPVAAPAIQPEVELNQEVGKLVNAWDKDALVQDPTLKAATPELIDTAKKAIIDATPLIQEVLKNPVVTETLKCTSHGAEEVIKSLAEVSKPVIPATVEAANAILAQNTPSEPVKPKRGRGRPRKSKNTVDMGDAPKTIEDVSNPTFHMVEHLVDMSKIEGQPNLPLSTDSMQSKLTYVPTCPDCNDFMAADDRLDMYLCVKHGRVDTKMKPSMLKTGTPPPPSAPIPETPAIEPPKTISVLTDVEQRLVKARLAPFWVDILPQAGMTADDGVSIWGKLIKFANAYFPDAPNYKEWTFDRWEKFFEHLDEFNTKNGPIALVEHINVTIHKK